jgi:hypothetical protein
MQPPPVDLTATISTFEQLLLSRAASMGLPSTNILVDVPQRVQVLNNLSDAMSALPPERRASSIYLSKFFMAVSAGLFDAALNYLWDETITELRKRIVDYDLAYFFDLAATTPEKRAELNSEEDLAKLTDDEVIRAAAKIGFISDLGHRQLDLVRFMRNHASAAHPNQHEIQPFQLLGYVETCIKEVITLPQSPTMVETSRLLANVKQETVTTALAASYATLFAGLRREQTEALANGLFGIYVAPSSTAVIRDNVRALLPYLWPHIPESVRFAFGVRFARFKANLDTTKATLAREFLERMGGELYLPEDVRVGEIDGLLDELIEAHYGMNNFHTEPPLAQRLQRHIGTQPVPEGVRNKYVAALVDAFLGRGSGLSWAADPIYEAMLKQLAPTEASIALIEATGANVAGRLGMPIPQQQLARLLDILKPKAVTAQAQNLEKAIREFSGPRHNMMLDSGIRRLREALEVQVDAS